MVAGAGGEGFERGRGLVERDAGGHHAFHPDAACGKLLGAPGPVLERVGDRRGDAQAAVGVLAIGGASVIPAAFSSAAISSRSLNFCTLVPDIGHSAVKRTYRGTL